MEIVTIAVVDLVVTVVEMVTVVLVVLVVAVQVTVVVVVVAVQVTVVVLVLIVKVELIFSKNNRIQHVFTSCATEEVKIKLVYNASFSAGISKCHCK